MAYGYPASKDEANGIESIDSRVGEVRSFTGEESKKRGTFPIEIGGGHTWRPGGIHHGHIPLSRMSWSGRLPQRDRVGDRLAGEHVSVNGQTSLGHDSMVKLLHDPVACGGGQPVA